jgi:hypothetical protein
MFKWVFVYTHNSLVLKQNLFKNLFLRLYSCGYLELISIIEKSAKLELFFQKDDLTMRMVSLILISTC